MRQFLILANKRYHTDFRKYLMRAAQRAGARALHIYCWENIILSRNGSEYQLYGNDVPVEKLRDEIETYFEGKPFVALTGLGCNENWIATRLQETLTNGVFGYDVYDDLLFDSAGCDRIERMLQDCIWRARCDFQILLNKDLSDRYPGASHLDNASHMTKVKPAPRSQDRLVYVGSIDNRVDFDWLRAAASTGVDLHIYGRIHLGSPTVEQRLNQLTATCSNVVYYGEYDNDDLWSILRQYSIGLLPYKVGDRLTRFINPDKLYHYLNSSLEVLASPISQVTPYARFLHLVEENDDWVSAIRSTARDQRAAAWPRAEFTWDTRWRQLLAIVNQTNEQALLAGNPDDQSSERH